ncbi:MAG: phage portal protein [Rickettsiaceae bacterium]
MKQTIKRLFKRNDGWQNPLTRLGAANSRTNNTIFRQSSRLDHHTLTQMYRTEGITKRIINIVVDDALRGFIQAEPELIKELKRVSAKQMLFDAASFGRLYGGALLVAFVDDGQDSELPLNTNRINKLHSLKVFDRHQVKWEITDICQDIEQPYYGEPEIFTITKNKQDFFNNEEIFFRVHRSRCFVFGGERISNSCKANNNGWDDSVLQACYDSLRHYGIIANSSVEIVQDFVQVIMKMNGLSDKVANGQMDRVLARLDIIDRSRSGQNTILLDGDGSEDYEKRSSSIAGLADLWDRFSETICATTGIPAARLFGRSPAGLNSSGESDQKNWNNVVSAYREDQLEPCLTWLIDMLQQQSQWQNKPSTMDWAFPALATPSEKEFAQIKKTHAEIDMMYIDRGAISASKAWQERFGSGQFQYNIKLPAEDFDNGEEEEEEKIEE